jgi:hypothetical protein
VKRLRAGEALPPLSKGRLTSSHIVRWCAAQENWAAFSPDGKWVAFSFKETGEDTQLFVTTFPKSNRRWLVSARGGFQARWRGDGKELFYLAADIKLTVRRGESVSTAQPLV